MRVVPTISKSIAKHFEAFQTCPYSGLICDTKQEEKLELSNKFELPCLETQPFEYIPLPLSYIIDLISSTVEQEESRDSSEDTTNLNIYDNLFSPRYIVRVHYN